MKTESMTLEELFSVAKRHLRAATPAKRPKAELPAENGKFTSPENWMKGQVITLIHQDTSTLLGVFQEYLHRSEIGARRLVREAQAAPTLAKEYVSGDWWVASTPEVVPTESWFTSHTVVLPLAMPELKISNPCVELNVLRDHGHLSRIELAQDTTFSGEDTFITFPAKTNLIRCLSLETKLEINQEIDDAT